MLAPHRAEVFFVQSWNQLDVEVKPFQPAFTFGAHSVERQPSRCRSAGLMASLTRIIRIPSRECVRLPADRQKVARIPKEFLTSMSQRSGTRRLRRFVLGRVMWYPWDSFD